MSRRRQAPHEAPVTPDPADRIAKVGLAWRELRRGASMQALRERIYQGEAGLIDMGLADALEVVALAGPCRMGDGPVAACLAGGGAREVLQPAQP